MKFEKNMGTLDRAIRVVIAVVIAVLYFNGYLSGLTATVLGIFAIIFIITSFVGICPLYTVVGLSTCKK